VWFEAQKRVQIYFEVFSFFFVEVGGRKQLVSLVLLWLLSAILNTNLSCLRWHAYRTLGQYLQRPRVTSLHAANFRAPSEFLGVVVAHVSMEFGIEPAFLLETRRCVKRFFGNIL